MIYGHIFICGQDVDTKCLTFTNWSIKVTSVFSYLEYSNPPLWVTYPSLLWEQVQADSAGCGQRSRTPQELHSGVHWGWVGGCPQGAGQDLLLVSKWQPASRGDRRLQQGQVGIHIFFSSFSGWGFSQVSRHRCCLSAFCACTICAWLISCFVPICGRKRICFHMSEVKTLLTSHLTSD